MEGNDKMQPPAANAATGVLFVLCNHLGSPALTKHGYVPVRHLSRVFSLLAAAGVTVHVVTPYRPSIEASPCDNPIYRSTEGCRFHSLDVLAARVQRHYRMSPIDLWEGRGVQVCLSHVFTPLVHFLLDDLKTTANMGVVVYEPRPTDPFVCAHPLARESERWTVYDGKNMPQACFPSLTSPETRAPYMGQQLTFAVSLTASADPWWIKKAVTAVRLSQPSALVVALCDMPADAVAETAARLPSDVRAIRCVDDEDKRQWYGKVFACIHMGQGEDDQSLLDVVGHGVPVIVNRSAHHVALLGKMYPLFALRPDIQCIRSCVDRVVSDTGIHASATTHVRRIQHARYAYPSVSEHVRRQIVPV